LFSRYTIQRTRQTYDETRVVTGARAASRAANKLNGKQEVIQQARKKKSKHSHRRRGEVWFAVGNLFITGINRALTLSGKE
jgi:hypothetical protein